MGLQAAGQHDIVRVVGVVFNTNSRSGPKCAAIGRPWGRCQAPTVLIAIGSAVPVLSRNFGLQRQHDEPGHAHDGQSEEDQAHPVATEALPKVRPVLPLEVRRRTNLGEMSGSFTAD